MSLSERRQGSLVPQFPPPSQWVTDRGVFLGGVLRKLDSGWVWLGMLWEGMTDAGRAWRSHLRTARVGPTGDSEDEHASRGKGEVLTC